MCKTFNKKTTEEQQIANDTIQVVSPFQAILDYELANNIPPGWVNFSISRTSPHGSWHKLERGEIKMDADFFANFNKDLRIPALWEHFHQRRQQNQTSNAASTLPPLPEVDAEWLFWEMMRISRTPDPYMFPVLKKLRDSGKFLGEKPLAWTGEFPELSCDLQRAAIMKPLREANGPVVQEKMSAHLTGWLLPNLVRRSVLSERARVCRSSDTGPLSVERFTRHYGVFE